MSKLIVMCGVSASGKTTKARQLSESMDATVLSSDAIREELSDDVSDQSRNNEVFDTLYSRAKELLQEDKNVIIDATNTNRKKRKHMINHELKMADKKIVHYMNTEYTDCLLRNSSRATALANFIVEEKPMYKSVPDEVILRQHKSMQIPVKSEGWDSVFIDSNLKVLPSDLGNSDNVEHMLDNIEYMITNSSSHNDLFKKLGSYVPDFKYIKDMPQDNSHHTFSVSRHTYYVYKYIKERTKSMRIIWASLFHDIGKFRTKTFYNFKGEEKEYASFYGHEYVSSQLALFWLTQLGYSGGFAKEVSTLCQFHMYPKKAGEKKMKEIRYLLGDNLYNDLMLLHEADVQAK